MFSRYELVELFCGGAVTALEASAHEDHEEVNLGDYLCAHLRYVAFRFKDCNLEYEKLDLMSCLE